MEIITGITTKNEDWIIDKTLCAVNNFVDKIIIYDDGSTDKTEEICRSYDKVEWFVRPSHNEFIREEAKQRMELINIISDFDPNYILLLDADEIPTPSIVNFINNIDESVTSWKIRMVNLWGDEGKYRYDSFITDNNVKINNDPFSKNSWCKYPLFKFEKGYDYTYNLGVQKGGCTPYHASPKN
jgi:glycosyltransferase involved in cell wall biosynthesis